MERAVSCRRSKYLWLAALLPGLSCAALTEEEMFFKGVSEVNGGDLKFLAEAPATPVHHHQNQITLNADSLLTGWARLEQCHRHLDPVPDMQIVYNRDRIRNIAITRSENIGHGWVHENSVQMTQVARDALICITAETQALTAEGNHLYTLSNGPYMRRFLDGYYPMRVSLNVRWDIPELRFLSIEPAAQTGFSLTRNPREIGFDAVFEGELRTRIQFSTAPQ
jgi:hypothetical protein